MSNPSRRRPSRCLVLRRLASFPAGLFAGALLMAGAAGAADPEEAPAGFWADREAAYRASARGPFTAVHAEYLEPGGNITVWVKGTEVGNGDVPEGAAAMMVEWTMNGFRVGPAEGTSPTLGGEVLEGARFLGDSVGDDADLRVGTHLVSLGLQADDLARVLLYDPARLDTFHGFPVFDDSDAFRIQAAWKPGDGSTAELGTTRGLVKPFVRAAVLEFSVGGEACRLTGFRSEGSTDGPLFVPYRDATSGGDSYGVGRYLRVDPQDDGTALVDFNRSTNPWCAYSPFYNCVLPPQENELAVEIRAGERAPAGH